MVVAMKKTVQIMKALADETRLRILALLFDGELCVCDLVDVLGLPQSTISRHLAYLRSNGWVSDRRRNKWMHYRVDTGNNLLADALIEVLQRRLPKIPAIEADREKLTSHLASGKQNTCG